MPETAAPPRWILFMLWPFNGEPCYPQIEGDLAEEFQLRVVQYGIRSARRWYYAEVVRNAWFLTCRWVMVEIIFLPLLCLLLHIFLFSIYRRLWSAVFYSWIHLIFDLLLQSLVGLSLGAVFSRLCRGHEKMIRLAFALYYLMIVAAWNAGIAHNLRHGMHVGMSDIPVILIYLTKSSLIFVWALICLWMGSVWIERNHRPSQQCLR